MTAKDDFYKEKFEADAAKDYQASLNREIYLRRPLRACKEFKKGHNYGFLGVHSFCRECFYPEASHQTRADPVEVQVDCDLADFERDQQIESEVCDFQIKRHSNKI